MFKIFRRKCVELIHLTDEISYLQATEKPLSCDVVFIKPKSQNSNKDKDENENEDENTTWIFDVGSNKKFLKTIKQIKGKKNIVLSHFHPDHILNLPFIKLKNDDNLFVGKYTKKYTFKGTVVSGISDFQVLSEEEKAKPIIFELPSSHAKSCLCLLYKDYCFTGDATYCKELFPRHTYNAQLLKAEIEVLEKLPCKYFCLSHDKQFIFPKEEIIELHKKIYSRAEKNNPTISVEDFFNSDGSVKENYNI